MLKVGFGASISSQRLTSDDQLLLLGIGAPKEPFAKPISTKRSVNAKNQNVNAIGLVPRQ
jgi:hypothetical protein